jgi:hypothetical protein
MYSDWISSPPSGFLQLPPTSCLPLAACDKGQKEMSYSKKSLISKQSLQEKFSTQALLPTSAITVSQQLEMERNKV